MTVAEQLKMQTPQERDTDHDSEDRTDSGDS